jgi:hypothetical protein
VYAAPYASYTFDFYGNPVPAAQAYAQGVLDGASLRDFSLAGTKGSGCIPKWRDLFLADTGNNRILKLRQRL